MGADNLRTIQFSAMGSNAGIGQNTNPNTRWPLVRVKTYAQEIDFTATASHVRLVRLQNGVDQTQDRYISRASSWDAQFSFWLTPFGFLKGAAANNPTVKSETIQGTRYNVVSFRLENKYNVVGYINDKNLVERVQTWVDNDVLGDMLAEVSYDVYNDFGGVKFPTSIIEKQGGFPVLILSVTDVKPNASVSGQPPASTATTDAAQPVSVQAEKAADGVFYLKGGTHHSVAVEFGDHVVVIEAPLNEERSVAVIAAVKKIIPNKPIRYLVNTHHHFDHSGGLRTYVDEGVTIVTHDSNKAFYQQAFAAPRTLNPDRLARSQKKPNLETFADKKVLSDGTRTLELHLIKANPHNDGILMAFLPKEKILIEADVFAPQNPAGANAVAINSNTVNTVENVERLKLDFETILPLHGPGAATRADLYKAINKPVPDMAVIMAAAPPPAPVEPAKRMLDMVCTACHNLNRVQSKNITQEEWMTIVERMKGKGAELSEDDTMTLLEYLVKNYGPK
jgi:glyoxylase-like metal-dependent hydrolase (beta-lactamase superfamily II)